MAREKPEVKRGPKAGRKHQSGRGHDRKSARRKKKDFGEKQRKKREQERENAHRVWAEYDALPDDVKRLLGPSGEPKMPRPSDG